MKKSVQSIETPAIGSLIIIAIVGADAAAVATLTKGLGALAALI